MSRSRQAFQIVKRSRNTLRIQSSITGHNHFRNEPVVFPQKHGVEHDEKYFGEFTE